MKKALICLVALLLACSFMLVGCSGSKSEDSTTASVQTETEADSSKVHDVTIDTESISEKEPVKELNFIFNCWGYADTQSMQYQKILESLTQGFLTLDEPIKINWTWAVCTDPDEQLSNIESVAEKGLDGAMCLYMSQALVDSLTEKGIYFGMYTLTTDELYEYAETSPYFVGTMNPAREKIAAESLQAVIDAGCTEIALVGLAPGNAIHDIMWPVWYEILEEHPEITWYESKSSSARADVLNDLFAVHPNIDAIVDTSAAGGYGDAAIQVIHTLGKEGEVLYSTNDLVTDVEAAFNDGIMIFTGSGTYGMVGHMYVAMLNKIMGTPLTEGAQKYYWNFINFTSAEEYNEFVKYCSGDIPMITFEEYKPFLKWINEDASNDDFAALAENISLEFIKENHKDLFNE